MIYAILFVVFGIIYFIKFKKEKTRRSKKTIIIGVIIAIVLIDIPVFKGFLKYEAIKYSKKITLGM